MKKLFRPSLAAFLMGTLLITSACGDDDNPKPVEEGELITTMTMTLVPQGKGGMVTVTYTDPDGDGGAAPTSEPLNLAANTTYDATIMFADDSPNGAGDLTPEIMEEGTDHEVFFTSNPASLLTVAKTDADANGRPIGLTATVTTAAAGTGTLMVMLKHQPDMKGNTSDSTKGETDVQAMFNVTVQ
ncbi:hypothetical protein [Pontibacter akesuensis]|nr:hypothetical protein [Pontibacter akesuensis]